MQNLLLDQTEVSHFTSKSQKIRVMSESWASTEIVCAACASQLQRSVANSKVLDFRCVNCTAEYELKSKAGKFTKKVTDGGYSAMMTRLDESNSPHFFFMSYDLTQYAVKDFFLVPSHFLRPIAIEARKPLSLKAKRAGWVGCNILLSLVPEIGKINYIKDGKFIEIDVVMNAWRKTSFLAESKSIKTRGWTIAVLSCVERIGHQAFTLDQMYKFETTLARQYPNNNFIKDKIRQQLQVLRDQGLIEFVSRGKYRLIND